MRSNRKTVWVAIKTRVSVVWRSAKRAIFQSCCLPISAGELDKKLDQEYDENGRKLRKFECAEHNFGTNLQVQWQMHLKHQHSGASSDIISVDNEIVL